MTGEDVVIHTNTWYHLQSWLDSCGRWVCKKRMKWESKNCTAICGSTDEISNQSIVPRIAGGSIKKSLNATYLRKTLSSKGVISNLNEESAGKALTKAMDLAKTKRLDTGGPKRRKKYIIEPYLRTTSTFNAFLLPKIASFQRSEK